MLRSLYSGISGMKNFQTKLDVIGNNIANVNTYGFKKGRTTFSDLISQTTSGATAPANGNGGINAKQVGLGAQVASIDTIHTQGSIGTDGSITYVDADGNTQNAGQITIAKFENPEGLDKVGGNTYQVSSNSGAAQLTTAGQNGSGSINSGYLEMSNVDLSEEFTEMIVSQRGFQANTKIITTSDEILQELVNLKR